MSHVAVVSFPITPYADVVAQYVNQLNDEQLRTIYAQPMFRNEPDVLTACLFAVISDSRDRLLFRENLNELQIRPHVFVAMIDNVYVGHIYAWKSVPSSPVVNMVGVRGPVLKECVQAIYERALIEDVRYLRYLQPNAEVAEVLASMDFKSVRERRNDRAWAWLFDDTSIGATPLALGMLFREWDMIYEMAPS